MVKKHTDIKELALQVEEMKKEFKDVYTVNESNLKKFNRVCDLMMTVAEESDGEITDMGFLTENLQGNVAMDVDVFDVYKDGLKAFKEVIGLADTFNVVQSDHDSVLVNVGVNNVWEAVPVK